MWQIINTYLCSFISLFGVVTFAKIVLHQKIKISISRLIFIFILISSIYVLSFFYLMGLQKTALMFLINTFFYKIIFKISIKKALFVTFLHTIILIIPELIEVLFFTQIFGMSREFFYEIYAGSILANLSICILSIILSYTLRKVLRKITNEGITNNTKIIVYSILVFICTGMFFFYKRI